jgi:hypothetical protein
MPVRPEPRRHRGADKRPILRGHYLFGKLTPQHTDRLSACIVHAQPPTAGAEAMHKMHSLGVLSRYEWVIYSGTYSSYAKLGGFVIGA